MKTRVVYLGVGISATGRGRLYQWAVLPDDYLNTGQRLDGETESVLFKRNITSSGLIGYIYEFDRDDNSWSVGGKLVERWKNEDQVAQWEAASSAAQKHLAAMGKKTKELRRKLSQEKLDPFRVAYREAAPSMRPQILAYVIEYITRK